MTIHYGRNNGPYLQLPAELDGAPLMLQDRRLTPGECYGPPLNYIFRPRSRPAHIIQRNIGLHILWCTFPCRMILARGINGRVSNTPSVGSTTPGFLRLCGQWIDMPGYDFLYGFDMCLSMGFVMSHQSLIAGHGSEAYSKFS